MTFDCCNTECDECYWSRCEQDHDSCITCCHSGLGDHLDCQSMSRSEALAIWPDKGYLWEGECLEK